jgi:hypothetical protein
MTALLLLALLQEKEPSATEIKLFTWDTYRFAADLEDEGEVAQLHTKITLDIRQFVSRQDMFLLQTGIDWVRYDFDGRATELWEDVYILRSDLVYMHFFDASWSGLVYGSLYDSYEEGAHQSDGLSYGAGVGFFYRSGPDFMIGAALRVVTRIEESPLVFLVPQIEWQFSPGWWVRSENRAGYTLGVSRELDPAWAVESRVNYWLRRFRLDEDTLPPEGVIQDDRVSWEVGVKWTPRESVWMAVHVGLDLWQEYMIEAKNGNDLDEITTDPAPYLSVSLSAAF